MSDFEDFLSAQAPAQAAGATQAPTGALAPPAVSTPPDDFQSFLTKIKGQQDAATLQSAQATAVANAHSGISADQAGQAAQIGRQVGLPGVAVLTDPDRFQAQAKADQNASTLSQNPVLAKWVAANPQSAHIAQDEYEQLSTVEKLWDGTQNTAMAAMKGLGGGFNSAALGLNRVLAAPAALVGAGDWWAKNMISPVQQAAPALAIPSDASIGQKAAGMAGNLLGLLSQITLTGGGSGEAVPAATSALGTIANAAQNAVRSMAFPSLTASVNTGHDILEKTGDLGAAAKAAMGSYFFTTMLGAVPFSAPGSLATRMASGALSGAATSEGQRAAMNLLLPDALHQNFDPQEAIFQALSGAVLGGVMGPRSDPHLYEAVRQTYSDALKAGEAQRDIGKVAALGEISAKSKLRESDPDAFHDFVSTVTDKSDLDAVYVNGAKLNEAFAQSKIEPTPAITDQMREALATGGDVRIPIADYATHIAGTDIEKTIMPEMKAAPDGMTFSEGQAFYQDAAKQMTDKAQQMARQRQAGADLDADKETVRQQMQDQLNATGRNPEPVNKAYSSLVSEVYATMAQRAGMKPSELFKDSPLNIAASGDGGLSQGQRGAYDPITRSIALLKDADLSTFLHESGHHFLEVMHGMARGEKAPEGIKSDFDTLLKSFGEKGDTPEERIASWSARDLDGKRSGHEQFASQFERYLMEGKAPSTGMQPLFSRFRSWLVNIYRTLSNTGAEMTPEVKGVMDRMLASDEAIKQAEQIRSYAPLFQNAKAAGMKTEDFNAYLELGKQATDQAVGDMQARSLRDMQWLSNAKSKALKGLQKQADAARKEVHAEVENEISAYPAFQAQEYMRTHAPAADKEAMKEWGERREAAAERAAGQVKDALLAANPDVKGLQKGQLLAKNKRALANQAEALVLEWEKSNDKPRAPDSNPMVADMVAEKFGFGSGDDMRRAIMEAGNKKDIIQSQTDQRMLQKHGELTDPQSIEQAANEAVHNEARARFMATGLKALTDSPIPANQIAKAAKQVADTTIAGRAVGDLRPDHYLAAEAKANKEAISAAARDPAKAIDAQRVALLNNRLFRAATEANQDVLKGVEYAKRFNKKSFRANLDVDVRDQADDLLSRFDLRQNPSDEPTRPERNLKEWAESQRQLGYAPNMPPDMLNQSVRMHYKDMTVEQFRGFVDSLKTLESIGRQRKEITIEGKKISLDQFVQNELVPKLQERGERFTKDELLDRPEERHTNPVAITLDHLGSWMRSAVAQLKPQSFKANEYDRHEILGPVNASIIEPVINANYNKMRMLKELSNDFARVGESLGREWQDSLHDPIKNDRLADPDKGVMMKFTRGKLLGLMIRGIGNESNLDKMAKGWGWDKSDVWAFVHEHATPKDFQAAQAVGDLFEKHWPDIEAMNRRLGNTSPDKIEPRPFPSKFGEQRGWYSPIDYDPLRSRRGESAAKAESINPSEGMFGKSYYRGDTTTNGSLNGRLDNYTDRVDLDFHTLPQRLQETIHDLAYRETLIDVSKVVEHPDFRREFRSSYGREAYSSLQEWLGNVANSVNYDKQVGALGRFLSYTRTGMVLNAIALRATTVLKHGGSAGVKTMGYFAGGGEKFLASRMAQMGTDYRNQIASAREKFGEVNSRLMQQDRDFRSTSASMFEPESALAKAERFGHAAVAWSDMMTAVPTAWAAYDRAIAEGIPKSQGGTDAPMTEEQAVNYANRIVREAHGSNAEAARSMVMNNHSEAVKMFTTLYGFMNNSFGQQLDGFDKLRTNGLSKTPVLARTFAAIIVPALWAGYLSHGGPDENKEETWWGWAAKSIGAEVAASVPIARDAYSMVEGYSHAGMVSTESWMATMVQAGRDIAKITTGESPTKAPIKDIANAVGMGLHIPGLGQIGTSAQYAADVASGSKQPEGAIDYAKGLVTGH